MAKGGCFEGAQELAKGGEDRSLTGITVIHGAYDGSYCGRDDSMAQDDSKAGDGGVVAGMLGMAGVVPGDGGRE